VRIRETAFGPSNWALRGKVIDCFVHPRGNEQSPVGGEGVLIELVPASAEVVRAFAALAAAPGDPNP